MRCTATSIMHSSPETSSFQWANEQSAYLAIELLADELVAAPAALGALAQCGRLQREACAAAWHDSRRGVAASLRAKLLQEPWGATCCREGARKLSLSGHPISLEMADLLRYAAATRVRELRLRNACVGIRGIRFIAAAAAQGLLDELEDLVVSHNFINDACLELLAEHLRSGGGGGFRRLRTLNLSNNYFGDRGLQALCGALTWRGRPCALLELRCLRIAANDIGAEQVATLASALLDGALPSLTKLVVPHGHERNAALLSACRQRRLTLV